MRFLMMMMMKTRQPGIFASAFAGGGHKSPEGKVVVFSRLLLHPRENPPKAPLTIAGALSICALPSAKAVNRQKD